MGQPNSDTYAQGDARMPQLLGKSKKINKRRVPETVFLTGKQKKKNKKKDS